MSFRTEKNATPWSKDKIKELLTSVKIENDECKCYNTINFDVSLNNFLYDLYSVICRVKDVTKCDGEASANNRKAKLIFFYEWTIQAEWEGMILENSKYT